MSSQRTATGSAAPSSAGRPTGGTRLALRTLREEQHWEHLRSLGRLAAEHRSFGGVALLPDDSVAAYRHAFRASATGAVPWTAPVPRIARCARAATEGDARVPSDVEQVLAEVRAEDEEDPPVELTEQERSFIRLLIEHGEINAVAEQALYGRKKVRQVIDGVGRRLGARSRYEAIAMLGASGLLRDRNYRGEPDAPGASGLRGRSS